MFNKVFGRKKKIDAPTVSVYETFMLLPNQSIAREVAIPKELQGKRLKGFIGTSMAAQVNVNPGTEPTGDDQIAPDHPLEVDLELGKGKVVFWLQNLGEVKAAGFVMLTAR